MRHQGIYLYLERVEAKAMLVGLGGERIDGCIVWADASLGAPASARLLRLVWRYRRTHALALPPPHALQQPDACGAYVTNIDVLLLSHLPYSLLPRAIMLATLRFIQGRH